MPLSALLGGLASLASNIYGTMYGADRADEDRALTLDLFNKSREFQLQDQGWTEDVSKRLMNYQYNKFSSPSAQMQAYKDADLNPWLMMQGGSVGSGQGVSVPGVSNPQRSGTPDVFRPQVQKDLFGDAGALITQASAIHNQRLDAKAKVASVIPDLIKGLGENGARKFISNVFGDPVDTKLQDAFIDVQLGRERIAKEREDLSLQISQEFDWEKANIINQNLLYEGQRIINEATELFKRGELHESEMDELVTRSAKNLAEKAHLKADTETINKLRPHIVRSANMQADMDAFDRIESQADFMQGEKAREWMRSDEGKMQGLANQITSDNSSANLINKITRGQSGRSRYQRRDR